jgi:hypothetical protein
MSTSSQPPRNETPETGKSSSTSSTSDLPPDLLSAIRELYVAGTVTLIEAYKMKCYYMLEEEDAKDPGPQVLEEFRKVLMGDVPAGSIASEQTPPANWDAKPTREGFIAIDKMKAERDRILLLAKEQSFMELRERTKRLVDGATKIVYKDNTFLDDSMTIEIKVPNSFLRGMAINDARRLVGMPPLSQHPMKGTAADLPWPNHPQKETHEDTISWWDPWNRVVRSRPKTVGEMEAEQKLEWENEQEEIPATISLRGGKPEATPGSSQSTAGTTSTSTPASREPSSSSTSSDLSDPDSGPSPSSASPGEITGSC